MDWIDSIKNYTPTNEQEKQDKDIIISCIEGFADVLTRKNKIVHVTSSGFVVNKERNKVLMVHHNIYHSWSLTGGHADGQDDLLSVALCEVREETGVVDIKPVMKDIFSLDILPVLSHMRKGEYVSAHLHLSVTFLLEADESNKLKVKEDENSDVRWIPMDKVMEHSNEPHMKKLYEKLITKIKSLI